MDLSVATNQPEAVTLGGETHLARPLTMKEWGKLQAWIKRELPSPVKRALDGLQQAKDDAVQYDLDVMQHVLDHAQQQALAWPPRIGSAAWFDLLNHIEGGVGQYVFTVLSLCNPALTAQEAEQLAKRASDTELAELTRWVLYGKPPVPKSPAPQTIGATATS